MSCMVMISLARPQDLGCEAQTLLRALHGEEMLKSGTIPLSHPISVQ